MLSPSQGESIFFRLIFVLGSYSFRQMATLAYLNGKYIPESDIGISVQDGGFVQGVIIAEQFGTFGGELFRVEEHFQRLRRSLEIVGIDGVDLAKLRRDAHKLATDNHLRLMSGDDLNLSIFVTPGITVRTVTGENSRPTVGMTTRPLPFSTWASKYREGQHLAISDYRQVPETCWPSELKCRSRMHYYLADRDAQQKFPGSRALLLDQDGLVAEASTASVLMFNRSEGIVAPPIEKVLPSISVATLRTFTDEMNIPFSHREITPNELKKADEVLLTSTSPCVLPGVSIDGATIGSGKPGQMFADMISQWSLTVGVDVIAQANRFQQR